jgi:hypothetical protein
MKECCEANSYGFPCWCSAYKGLRDIEEEDNGRGDYERDRQKDREWESDNEPK